MTEKRTYKYQAAKGEVVPERTFLIVPAEPRSISADTDKNVRKLIPEILDLVEEHGKGKYEESRILVGFGGFSFEVRKYRVDLHPVTEISIWSHPGRTEPFSDDQKKSVADIRFFGWEYDKKDLNPPKWEKEWEEGKCFKDHPSWQNALLSMFEKKLIHKYEFVTRNNKQVLHDSPPAEQTVEEENRINRGREFADNLIQFSRRQASA